MTEEESERHLIPIAYLTEITQKKFCFLKIDHVIEVKACMNITPLRTVALVGAAFALLSFCPTPASAQVAVSIRVGTPPPPPPAVVYQRWPAPYHGAVWIPGHHEWVNGRWVYVGGYYGYPPRRGAVWIAPRYHHGYYYPGYWR